MNVGIITGVHGNEHSANIVGLKLKDYYEKNVINELVIDFHLFSNQLGGLNNTRDCKNISNNDLNRWDNPDVISCEQARKSLDYFIKDKDLIIDIHNSPNCSNIFLGHYNVDYSTELNALITSQLDNKFVIWPQKSYTNARRGRYGFTYELRGMNYMSELDKYIDEAVSDISKFIDTFYKINKSDYNSCDYNQDDYLLKSYYSPATCAVVFNDTSKTYYKKGELICTLYDLNKANIIDTIYAHEDMYVIDYGYMYANLNQELFLYKSLR